MATYYIDPDWTGAKNGTEAEPYANFSSITPANSDVYKFKRGTTHTSASTLANLKDSVTVEDYGDTSLARPILTTTDNANVLNIRGNDGGMSQTIRNVELALTSAVNTNPCISISEVPPDFSVLYDLTIDNCVMHGGKQQINMSASGVTISNCTFYDAGEDNCYLEGAYITVDNCDFSVCGRDELGDNIQFADTGDSGNASNCILSNCTLDKSNSASKNCAFMGFLGAGNKMFNNTAINFPDAGISAISGEVYNNTSTGGLYQYNVFGDGVKLYSNTAIADNTTTQPLLVHDADNMEVYGNIVDFTAHAVSPTAAISLSVAVGTKIHNNTIYGNSSSKGIRAATAGVTNTEVVNNIILNCDVAMQLRALSSNTENNNVLFGNASNITDEGGTPVTPDTTDALTDPQLTNYYPASTSPCIGTGVKCWTGANPVGIDGEPFADFETDIGAIQGKWSSYHPTRLRRGWRVV